MTRRTALTIASVTFLVIAGIRIHGARDSHVSDPDQAARRLLQALDDRIQQRFRETDGRFGITRIVRLDDSPHTFRPEHVGETTAVEDLQRAGIDVVLYVTGRRVLREQPDGSWPQAARWRLVKGPVIVAARPKDVLQPPAPIEMWEVSRKAMQAFAVTESYDARHDGWTVVARPVRASDLTCLTCHPRKDEPEGLRMGDALGAVLYAYRRR